MNFFDETLVIIESSSYGAGHRVVVGCAPRRLIVGWWVPFNLRWGHLSGATACVEPPPQVYAVPLNDLWLDADEPWQKAEPAVAMSKSQKTWGDQQIFLFLNSEFCMVVNSGDFISD